MATQRSQQKKQIVEDELPIGALTSTATQDKQPIIEMEHVNKYFRVGKTMVHILHDVNTKIYPQEFIVILGPSGSGKSTMMNTILGLESPSTGKVVVKNESLVNKKMNQLAKFRYHHLGVVFQRPEWIRSLTVIQNVAFPLAIAGMPKSKRMPMALNRLKQLGMDDHANYFPTELSGGQQQKVTIARALINDPEIIIADEPTGNLDTTSADNVMELLKTLNEKHKKTILMVTHNIDYVRYASRTIYIRDGRIVQGSEHFLGTDSPQHHI
jgi:putative ABC transport system ATP-binding protein